MSHTKHVFVVNNADDTGMQTTENSLGANDLGVYDNDVFQTTIAALDAGDTFQLANSQYSSPRLNFSDIVKVVDIDGQDGTAQVNTVTVALDSGRAEIKLIDVTDGREKFSIATFEASGTVVNDVATALAAAIQASTRDGFKDVTASATGAAVAITSPKNVVLRVACNDASSTTQTTAPVLSVGTVADVNAEFEDALPFQGVTNIAGPNVVKPASNAAGQYDRLSIYVEAEVGARSDMHEIAVYFKADNNEVAAHLATLFGFSTATTQS